MLLLLSIIYLAFISLGLPDALLGAAWPIIYPDMRIPLSYSGIVFVIISVGTVISSLNSDRITRRFGTGRVTAISTFLTMLGLFGFSFSTSFWQLCLWAIPYGLGAGAIDSALNNYVALHYASHHMSWLHCMWGIGASIGPYIMGYALLHYDSNWHLGYRIVAFLQLFLTIVLFLTLSLWKQSNEKELRTKHSLRVIDVLKIPGVKEMILTFFCYCALEQTAGLWIASWLVKGKGVAAVTAAQVASFYYIGITVGRAISGFITFKLNDKQMVQLGTGIIVIGLLCILQPWDLTITLVGLVVIGLGCAPIYPSLIHATPDLFGVEQSQSVIGVQMASAYIGTSIMPPFFGFLANLFGIGLFPFYLIAITLCMMIGHRRLCMVKGK